MKNVKVRESVLSISVSQHQEEKEPIIYTALTGDSQCFLAGYSFDTNTPTCSVGFALYDSRTLKRQTSLNISPQTVSPETTKLEDVHHLTLLSASSAKGSRTSRTPTLAIAASAKSYLFILSLHPPSGTLTLLGSCFVSSWRNNSMQVHPNPSHVLIACSQGIARINIFLA